MGTPRETLQAVRGFVRDPFAWPGGYPRVLVMADGEILCAGCARAEYRQISDATRHPRTNDQWRAVAVEILWEGPAEHCAHCECEMPTAYGDPESPDTDNSED